MRGEMLSEDYEKYYNSQLKEGNEYQDYILNKFIKNGICFINYSTRKYQNKYGENSAGIEIKLDKKFRETGNLYIETAEKSNPINVYYIKSGIFRNDNTWLYVIGDYDTHWIFSKKRLINIYKTNIFRAVQTDTSQGYLLPISKANKYCMNILK